LALVTVATVTEFVFVWGFNWGVIMLGCATQIWMLPLGVPFLKKNNDICLLSSLEDELHRKNLFCVLLLTPTHYEKMYYIRQKLSSNFWAKFDWCYREKLEQGFAEQVTLFTFCLLTKLRVGHFWYKLLKDLKAFFCSFRNYLVFSTKANVKINK
jgi:hypothetical protein